MTKTVSGSVKRSSIGKIVNSPRRCSPMKKHRRSSPSLTSSSNDCSDGTNIHVSVRVRPMNDREESFRNIIEVVDDKLLIFDPKSDNDEFFFHGKRQIRRDLNKKANRDHKFAFDNVFDAHSTNESVFLGTTHNLIDTLFKGYNCSVFVYGATGAGKTFTMVGNDENPGITFRTVLAIYERIESLCETLSCEIAISYLEIYNETIVDLLNRSNLTLNIREDGNHGVSIPGLSLHKPSNPETLLELLRYGNSNRSQHPTDSNAESSRSHAVFQVYIKQQDRSAGLSADVKVSKLSMIDLAGSERGSATLNRGLKRLREGANINKSLLALGNCINALSEGSKYIPYRNSKLTRLLKDSIGGNCQTVMISNISPSSNTYEDTYNTLKYADRAKRIKIKLRKNVVSVDFHVARYAKIVEDLKKEILELKEKKCFEEERAGYLKEINELKNSLKDHEECKSRLAQLEKTTFKSQEDQTSHDDDDQTSYNDDAKTSHNDDDDNNNNDYYVHVSKFKLNEMKIVQHYRVLRRIETISKFLPSDSRGTLSVKKIRKTIEHLKSQNVEFRQKLEEHQSFDCEKITISQMKAKIHYQHILKFSKLLIDENRKTEQLFSLGIPLLLSCYLQLKNFNVKSTSTSIDEDFESFIAQTVCEKVVWNEQLTSNNLDTDEDLLGSFYATKLDLLCIDNLEEKTEKKEMKTEKIETKMNGKDEETLSCYIPQKLLKDDSNENSTFEYKEPGIINDESEFIYSPSRIPLKTLGDGSQHSGLINHETSSSPSLDSSLKPIMPVQPFNSILKSKMIEKRKLKSSASMSKLTNDDLRSKILYKSKKYTVEPSVPSYMAFTASYHNRMLKNERSKENNNPHSNASSSSHHVVTLPKIRRQMSLSLLPKSSKNNLQSSAGPLDHPNTNK